MRKSYFRTEAGQPAPLRYKVKRRVRFEEVDPLQIVWHGRYPSYFEDARVALCEKFGIGYLTLYNNGILAPIKKMHIDYHLPLNFQDEFEIDALLHWSEAARINMEFVITHNGDIASSGYTVQLMLDYDQNLFMLKPHFYKDFCDRWKAGEFE